MQRWRNFEHPLLTPNLAKLSAGVLPVLQTDSNQFETQHESRASKDIAPSPLLPRLELRPSPGKGLGLFALDVIPAYTKILEDDALISLAPGEDWLELWQKYRLLPPELKTVLDGLSFPASLAKKEGAMLSALEELGFNPAEAQEITRVNLRWHSNVFATGSPAWPSALFPTVARINHSCTAAALAHYRPSGAQVVYALREIAVGEEVEIGYFDVTLPVAERRRHARGEGWGFECGCPACRCMVGTGYEEKLALVHAQFAATAAAVGSEEGDDGGLRDELCKAIDIALTPEYPWLVLALPKLYLSLYKLELRVQGRTKEVRGLLEKVLEWEVKTTGPESPFSRKRRRALVEFDAAGDCEA